MERLSSPPVFSGVRVVQLMGVTRKLLTLQEHLSSRPVLFSGVRVVQLTGVTRKLLTLQ